MVGWQAGQMCAEMWCFGEEEGFLGAVFGYGGRSCCGVFTMMLNLTEIDFFY